MSSNQSIAFPNIALNLAVSEALDYVATELEKATSGPKAVSLAEAVGKLLPSLIKENKRIIFNGNNYSQEWEDEAKRRGLLNLRNTVDALPEIVKPEVLEIFERFHVLNEREVRARYEVALENYNKTLNVEGQLMVLMANRYILPAALRYQGQVASTIASVTAAGGSCKELKKALDEIGRLTDELKRQTDALDHALDHSDGTAESHAKYFRDKIVPLMVSLRETGDALECVRAVQISGRFRRIRRCCS